MKNERRLSINTNQTSFFDIIDEILNPHSNIFNNDGFNPPKINTQSYPVANCFINEDDNSLNFEIAVTGFEKEDIEILREDNTLTISGKCNKSTKENTRIIYNNLPHRDFKLVYKIHSKMNLDELEANIKNGILYINIPIDKSQLPISKIIKIK